MIKKVLTVTLTALATSTSAIASPSSPEPLYVRHSLSVQPAHVASPVMSPLNPIVYNPTGSKLGNMVNSLFESKQDEDINTVTLKASLSDSIEPKKDGTVKMLSSQSASL